MLATRIARLVLVLLASLTAAGAGAKERLQVSPWIDAGIAAGTVALWLGGASLAEEPELLTRPARNPPGGIDDWAPRYVRDGWLTPSDAIVWVTIAAGGVVTAVDGWRDENLVAHLVIFAEAMLINQMVTDVTKQLTLRARPFTYSEPGGGTFDVHSFFSGHTSNTATAAFAAARILDLSGDLDPWERVALYGTATALTGAVASARVAAGMHFPTDVLVGGLVGTAIGLGVPELHRPGGWIFGGGATDGGGHVTVARAF